MQQTPKEEAKVFGDVNAVFNHFSPGRKRIGKDRNLPSMLAEASQDSEEEEEAGQEVLRRSEVSSRRCLPDLDLRSLLTLLLAAAVSEEVADGAE